MNDGSKDGIRVRFDDGVSDGEVDGNFVGLKEGEKDIVGEAVGDEHICSN